MLALIFFKYLEILAKANMVILNEPIYFLQKSSIPALFYHFIKMLIRDISCQLLSMLSFSGSQLGTKFFRVYKWKIYGGFWPNYLLRYRPESFLVGPWQDVHSLFSLLWVPVRETTFPFTHCSYFRMVILLSSLHSYQTFPVYLPHCFSNFFHWAIPNSKNHSHK